MKKRIILIAAAVLMLSTLAFARGDNNQRQHDGSKGKGQTQQERNNRQDDFSWRSGAES